MKVHRFYNLNLSPAANSSLGSKVNIQLDSNKIQDQNKSLFQLGIDARLLLALGVRTELPGRKIKKKRNIIFKMPRSEIFHLIVINSNY